MKQTIINNIQQQYGFKIKSIQEAPRQFVAETFILELDEGQKYFCKVISKHLFIPRVITSLPILAAMYKEGLSRINYPIKTMSGDFHIMVEKTLVTIFNYIDARQSYEYDNKVLGNLMAQVHKITPKIKPTIPKEDFKFSRREAFEEYFKNMLTSNSQDPVTKKLHHLLKKYEEEIIHDLENFLILVADCQNNDHNFVITHGDIPGNTLVKKPDDLYFIDWDDILLAPAERDLWFLKDKKDFIIGYRSVFSEFVLDLNLAKFYLYQRYFNDLVEYFVEILGDYSLEHRKNNLKQLEHDCLEGWLRPEIRRIDPI